MTVSDQQVKLRIVLLTAAFALLGFVLEIGPVGGVFSLSNNGPTVATALSLELVTLGFLAYLALAASAVVGLHLSEKEPVAKEPQEGEPGEQPPVAGAGAQEGVRERVRPELHQLRMLFTALGGFALLKGISLVFMASLPHPGSLTAAHLSQLFQFGFAYIALSWFVLWQFLRWYAQQRRWIRLQDELIGVDVTRIIAAVVLLKPLWFFASSAIRGTLSVGALGIMTILLNLTFVAIAVILWRARPYTLRSALMQLGITGGVIVVLTIVLAVIERGVVG